jgi:CheY-like chemotaxis protein
MDTSDDRVRVLVVEDYPDAAESLRVLLALWGYDVRVAGNGEAALGTASWFQPAAALIDLGLPGTDGFEVARRFQQLPEADIPVLVAATGHVGPDTRRRAWQAGFDYFVPKPFDVAYLREILAGAVRCPDEYPDLCESSPQS